LRLKILKLKDSLEDFGRDLFFGLWVCLEWH